MVSLRRAPRWLTAALLGCVCLIGVAQAETGKTFEWKAGEGLKGAAIRVANEGDGTVEVADIAGVAAVRNTGKSSYVYVDLPAGFDPAKAYVIVEFLDEGFGSLNLEYDSQQPAGAPLSASYRPAEVAHGAMRLETGAWRRAVFELARPGFKNRQNYGCDLRLSAGGFRVAIASLRVSDTPPNAEDLRAVIAAGDLGTRPPIVTVGPGVESTIGGCDIYDVSQTENWKEKLLQDLPTQHLVGATSHETYVVWRCCEAQRDKWEFSHYDACVAAHEKTGLKWVPFVILGPSYTLPDWYFKSDERYGYKCLEHSQECDIQSLWAPRLAARVEEYLTQFSKRYKDRGVIESVLLGITGNYGEAIYPASGNDWTADIHGKYHTHAGMWCGDAYAVADFQKWLKSKYGTLEKLNAAWGAQPQAWDSIQPVKNEKEASARAWLDTVDWYREAMNGWIGLWLRVATREMPGLPVYLCTGGHAPPEHGSEFGAQSKIAAKYHCGVRITNEGSDFAANSAITRWVSSACRFYGTYFGFEPASGVDDKGIVARIFNATSSGAKQLHHYSDNILGSPKNLGNWRKYGHFMKLRQPKIDVAVWYPNRMVDLRKGDVWRLLREMREVCDYDFADDRMIRDGALERYRIVVCISGGPYEADVLQGVQRWLRDDRTLFRPAGEGFDIVTVEGDKQLAAGWKDAKGVQSIPADAKLDGYWPVLRQKLGEMGIGVTGVRGVYAATFQDGSALLLNMTSTSQSVTVRAKRVAVPPVSIIEVP